MIAAVLKDPKVWIATGVAIVVAILWGLIISYGEARYREGAKDQRLAWMDDLVELQQKARSFESELNALRQEHEIIRRQRDTARLAALESVREEIQNAPDVETALSAFVEFRDGLRDTRRTRHDQLRADYLSSISAGGGTGDAE